MFFKDFKEKNKGKWASIINGMDLEDSVINQQTDTDKQEEIEMLKEFEKRRKFESVQGLIDKMEQDEGVDPTKRFKPEVGKSTYSKETMELLFQPNRESGENFDPK